MTGWMFWAIQGPGWVLALYLLVAQCSAALDYDLGVRLGSQEPASGITEVGVAFFKGYAGADLIYYTPLLILALGAHALGWASADLLLAAALGVTVYWPIACLWTVRAARGAPGWSLPKERQYWIVLPLIAGWAALALVALLVAGAA